MPRVWLPIRRSRTRHLPVSWLGRHLPQHCPVGAVEAPIRDPFPVAAGGIVHGVIEPPTASVSFVKSFARAPTSIYEMI